MHLLVTGSSGVIGTGLCERLLRQGDTFTGIDRVPNRWHKAIEGWTLHRDLLKADALEGMEQKNIDAIIHLAAHSRVYDLIRDPAKTLENFHMLFHSLECARKHQIPLLFASSRECYGNVAEGEAREGAIVLERCESPYAASKLGGEALVHAYRTCFGLRAIILRFANVYGAYDTSDRVIPLFLRKALRNEPLVVFGERKSLDFTYIDDAIEGALLALDRFETAVGGTFNIASGEETFVHDLAKTICTLLGSTSPISVEAERPGEVSRFVADTALAEKMLGFRAHTPLEEGLRKAAEWYRAHS